MLELRDIKNKRSFLERDKNGRAIYLYKLEDISVISQDLKYPNILFFSHYLEEICNPIEEKIMSLLNAERDPVLTKVNTYDSIEHTPHYFFGYNTDNYYHYVYDTLPYLIPFIELKKEIPNLKLLICEPVHGSNHYKFVTEFLYLCGIHKEDISFLKSSTLYKEIYISSSFTHGIDSNLPPREEIYKFYQDLAAACNDGKDYPDKIYISRRTWIHNDLSNIGTNYTTRRRLTNEDELVDLLRGKNYKEVFTEQLSTIEKLNLFRKVKFITGAIGGGMCNALFSPPETKVNVLVSPVFLEVNKRFKYCFSKVNTDYFNDTRHTEDNYFKRYMRVQHSLTGIIGEIESISDSLLDIKYSDANLAGWNSNLSYKILRVDKSECRRLDGGLNSNWKINIPSLNNLK